MAWPKFLKKEGRAALFNGPGEMSIFIPEKMYDLKLAFSAGEYQNIFGLVPYCLIDDKGKKGPLKYIKEPTRFLTRPYKIDKLKGVKLLKTTKEQDYRVLCYKKGDQVISDILVPMDITNVEDFISLTFVTGNLLNVIPYDELWYYFIKNMEIQGEKYNVTAQMFGIALAESCRDINNIEETYRNSGNKDLTAYNMIGLRDVSRMISAYSAFTSDNFTQSAVHAMMNDKKVEQPLERVLTGD